MKVVSAATITLEKLVYQVCYPFHFNEYVKELETEKENLQSKIQEVQDRDKDAKKKTHEVVREVESWLNKSNFLMAEVVVLQEKTKDRDSIFCLKLFPNMFNRYNLAKQLKDKTNEIKTHNQVQFSRLATLVGMNYFPSQDFVYFDSRKAAYDHLLRALKDEGVHMIGLHGMGGSGKTTLVKQVGREAENFFDKVLFVVVSNTYDVRKIQSNIAAQLSFELKEEESPERAFRLNMRLSGGERCLIILDDVWEKLDFKGIGIPIAKYQMGCTVVITTRKFHVCERMSCEEIIRLEGLNEDESWALFQKHAGLFDDLSNNLKDMAQNITKVCDGLPIVVAAVANTLKNKPHEEWVEALKTLRNPSWIDVEEGLKSTYGCLRLSYDNLENEAVKSLFLLCSVYPEGYEIPTDELIIIGLGLGLVGEIPTYRVGTQVINKAIKNLIDSCLLKQVVDQCSGSDIKMHDLVHDVAKWIANKENKLIMGSLKEDVIMEDHAVRYLWFEVDKCPNKLNCPKLEFLRISIYSKSSVTIPDDFFNSTKKLRVLTLANPTCKEDLALQLPISLHLINNLRCLKLYQWVLGDISFIGSLERLESLTIWGCSFGELPTCIIQQKQLRLLDLRACKIQMNPFEVMGRCSQLEVLYFFGNSGKDWEDQNNNSAKFFDNISTTTRAVESYCIQFGNIGKNYVLEKDLGDCKSFVARGLYIEDFESCISIGTSKDMIRRAKTLSLKRIPERFKNIIPDLWQSIGGGMNELTCLALCTSDGMECVIGQSNPSQVGIIFDSSNFYKGYSLVDYKFETGLENIIESMDDSSKETMQQINCQETGGQSNDQKLTIIATPNLTENKKESEDRRVHEQEMSKEKIVEGRVQECTRSENVQIVTSFAHSEPASSTKSVNQIMRALEISAVMPTSSPRPQTNSKQSTSNLVDISIHQTPSNHAELVNTISTSQYESKYQQQQSLAKNEITKKDVKGISEGSPSSENAKIIVQSIDSKLAISSTKFGSHNKKESEDPSAHMRDKLEEKSEEVRAEEYTSSKIVRIVPSLAHSEPARSSKTVRDLEIQSAQKETISRGNDVKASFEGSLSSENANMFTPSTLSHIQTQIKVNPSNSDVEDMKEDDLISALEAIEDEYGSKSPILSDPTIATAKDELVAKALADLEDSLKLPLKDIATSEANCLRIQTALNFLSHPSLEDRALSHGVMATIKSMHKDLPDILSSFKQAYATLNKFAMFEERDKSIKYQLSQRKEVAIDLVSKTSEAQEKEARLKEQISRLEKERKYYEAELLSLQGQKRKYIAETAELKEETKTVRKGKSEMLEDQRNAQQLLFQAGHKWSVLGSQFERNIADRNLS